MLFELISDSVYYYSLLRYVDMLFVLFTHLLLKTLLKSLMFNVFDVSDLSVILFIQ